MLIRGIDALTSATLKHLREHWWTDSFTNFLEQALKPRPGKRLLDVGCGNGTAEQGLARLRISQVELYGIDLLQPRVADARAITRGMNARAEFAAADACHLPFPDAIFDCTFCVAVLQHVRDIPKALREFTRVTRAGGRILAVEPDNLGRYWFSSVDAGMRAFDIGRRFFVGLAEARGEAPPAAVGPLVPGLLTAAGVNVISVDLFPVSASYLGMPPEGLWKARHAAIEKLIAAAPNEGLRRMGLDYAKAVAQYEKDAAAAGAGFVEIQNTMLFASVGQRSDA